MCLVSGRVGCLGVTAEQRSRMLPLTEFPLVCRVLSLASVVCLLPTVAGCLCLGRRARCPSQGLGGSLGRSGLLRFPL